mgnify:CR=1 FL=1
MIKILAHDLDLQGYVLVKHEEMAIVVEIGGGHVPLQTNNHMTILKEVEPLLGQLILPIMVDLAKQIES